jgi:hypothetical protein
MDWAKTFAFEHWIIVHTDTHLLGWLQGFSFLYFVSFIPVIIVVTVILILFFNSLQ